MDKSIKILIVDDFASMRRIIKNLLRDLGFKNTKEATDGMMALELLKKENYDFLITDTTMPKMHGVELIQAIKQDVELQIIPILLVVPSARRKIIVEAADAGIDDYIVKPFTSDQLAVKINKIGLRIESKNK